MASRSVESPRARALVVISTFALFSACGPYHEGGGGGGAAGDGAGGDGAAGSSSAGTGGVGGAGGTSAGTAGNAGATGGSAGTSGSAGGVSFPDSVIGCEAATWPESGLFFEPSPVDGSSTEEEFLLWAMDGDGLSGDGKVVVGETSFDIYRGIAISWTLSDGLVRLPPVIVTESGEGYFESTGFQASCDGSVILQKDFRPFGLVYRTTGADRAPNILIGSPRTWDVHMSPDGSLIVDGRGFSTQFETTPQRWTTSTGREPLTGLVDEHVYGVAPDGTLIAGNADVLFEYDVEADARTPIGMAEVSFGRLDIPSLRVSASGTAWAQSADEHHDSFLVWRPPAPPRSVTCPDRCEVIDLSGTGEVVLVDVPLGSTTQSLLWTERTGFIDLTSAVTQMGVELGGKTLRASAISDDGRVLTGDSFDAAAPVNSRRFFFVVLPVALFE